MFQDRAQSSRAHHQQNAIDPSTGLTVLTLPASYISSKQELVRIDSTSPTSLVAFFTNEADVSQLNTTNIYGSQVWSGPLARYTSRLPLAERLLSPNKLPSTCCGKVLVVISSHSPILSCVTACGKIIYVKKESFSSKFVAFCCPTSDSSAVRATCASHTNEA